MKEWPSIPLIMNAAPVILNEVKNLFVWILHWRSEWQKFYPYQKTN